MTAKIPLSSVVKDGLEELLHAPEKHIKVSLSSRFTWR